nr:PREDICTED: uncharacterized protein LOC105670031 [Linepithema humile]
MIARFKGATRSRKEQRPETGRTGERKHAVAAHQPVFLIRPRNEYPVVGFIATRGAGNRARRGGQGDIDGEAVSPTFPLKEIVLETNSMRRMVLDGDARQSHSEGD